MMNRRSALKGMAALPSLLTLPVSLPGQQSNVDEEIRKMAEQPPLSMRFQGKSAEECRAWQRAFAAKLGELLGPHQPPQRWETITERTVEAGDHRRDELVLRAAGHRDLPVYLLTPRGSFTGKRPGILALHGHGPFGYDAVAGIATTPERQQNIAELHYDYGLQLVRRGYVVVAPCFTPFGRRLDNDKAGKKLDACGVTFIRMQFFGKVLMAENLRDALWSIALLTRQENVDPARLGCVGLSYGGRMTMLTLALSPQIRVAVISGALNVMQERVRGQFSCGAQVIPGLLNYGDVPEIASLIAPRLCLWEVGRNDNLMLKEWIDPALERMRRAWRAFDAFDRLDVDYFEGKHQWSGVKAYPLLAKVLGP
jgi:dienelactone hydrolase